MDLNGFKKDSVHVLIPLNNESGEPEIKNIGHKFQDKNEFIFRHALSDARLNQIIDVIEEKNI